MLTASNSTLISHPTYQIEKQFAVVAVEHAQVGLTLTLGALFKILCCSSSAFSLDVLEPPFPSAAERAALDQVRAFSLGACTHGALRSRVLKDR